MRLLASTDFALRTLMQLACESQGEPLKVEQLAALLGNVSQNHLHKVVQTLAGMGLVRTIRGHGGGVVLAVAPDMIRVGQLIRDLEGDQPVVECFRADGGKCTLSLDCRLRRHLRNARDSFFRDLDQHTIADCLPPSKSGKYRIRHDARPQDTSR
jgi:Rrf2 family nitric oxide-sensitive transcriptional repressor